MNAICRVHTTLLPILAAVTALIVFGCTTTEDDAGLPGGGPQTTITVPVERQDMNIRVSASGLIEPIREIEIKSKASGKILRLSVESGDRVTRGALLALVDTTEVAANLRQSLARLEYVRSQYRVAERAKNRADDLYRRGMISEDEYDTAQLEYTGRRADLISSEADVDKKQEQRNDTVLRAPIAGTILEKDVEEGQIIASATSAVSEGTTLMKMADLTRVQVRVLVDESDVGRVHAGQHAAVTADAYPDRKFEGEIDKIEPVPESEQNVTFYPVLIAIDNSDRLLLPGMRMSAEIDVLSVDSVVTVSSDAVVLLRDAGYTGTLINVPEDDVKAVMDSAGVDPMARDKAVVFVADTSDNSLEPVVVSIGVRDWNLTEITDGLKEGQIVLVPPSASIARQFQEYRERYRQWNRLPGQN